jgi:hypothetical protein
VPAIEYFFVQAFVTQAAVETLDEAFPPILALMTEADIRAVFAAVTSDARKAFAPMVGDFDLIVIACQEQLPSNTLEGYDAYKPTLKWPWLTMSNKADASM